MTPWREWWPPGVSPHARTRQPPVTRSPLKRFRIRQIDAQANLPNEIALAALGVAVPHAVVTGVVADRGMAEHRRRP